MLKRCLQVIALVTAQSAITLGGGTSQSNSRAATDKYQAWRTEAVQTLIARADANSLATAAALTFAGPALRSKAGIPQSGPSALDLAARASELAPQNAGIGWLHLQLCADTPACDVRDVATVMRWVDADNGAAWLPKLAVAQRAQDTAEVDRILMDMAHGARFDLYWNRIVVLMFDALNGIRNELPGEYSASDWARLTTLSGIASAEIIPPFAPLVDACRESTVAPERRDDCMKLSKTMQRGDAVMAQMVGFGIEKRLLVPDSKEARAVGERKHVLEWRMTEAAKFDTPLLPWMKNARARARLAKMRSMPREEDVCIAILRAHKVAIEPPEDHR